MLDDAADGLGLKRVGLVTSANRLQRVFEVVASGVFPMLAEGFVSVINGASVQDSGATFVNDEHLGGDADVEHVDDGIFGIAE